MREAYGRLGYDIIVRQLPAERALVTSDSGSVDGEAGRLSVIEKSNLNLIRVPTPIYETRVVVWSLDKDLDVSEGWKSVARYKLGTLLGFKYVEAKTYKMNRVLVPTNEKLFEMLKHKRIDIVVLSLFEGLTTLKGMGLDNVYTLDPPLGVLPVYHYLHEKNAKLVPQIDKVFREMEEEGRFVEIVKELEAELRSQ
ncbi:MAG: transporter substrate-binding domain-containing protein [Pseudodesulfovibrio sp.]